MSWLILNSSLPFGWPLSTASSTASKGTLTSTNSSAVFSRDRLRLRLLLLTSIIPLNETFCHSVTAYVLVKQREEIDVRPGGRGVFNKV